MKRLGEIALFTSDVDRLVEFYGKVLESAPLFWQRGEAASFALGDVTLFLHRRSDSSPDSSPGPADEDHIAFLVDDVDAENARLREGGVGAQTPPRDFYWGRSAYYRDPDGRQVELHRPLPSPLPGV